jgi:hypothetical protein
LTKDVNEDTLVLPDVPKEFTKILEPGKNYTLRSDYVIQHAENSTLKYILMASLVNMAPRSGNPEQIRVLDDDACRAVLNTIHQEQETQSWVSSLIDK